jgi:hypothetical protein
VVRRSLPPAHAIAPATEVTSVAHGATLANHFQLSLT